MPALEMVDDILDVKKCGVDDIKSNSLINTFIEHKKMSMGRDKCEKIHCIKKMLACLDSKVHNMTMHNSDEVQYLGDQITSSANNVKTISKPKSKRLWHHIGHHVFARSHSKWKKQNKGRAGTTSSLVPQFSSS